MIPVGLVAALGALLPRVGYNLKDPLIYSRVYGLFGVMLIIGGAVVFFFGRRVNGVSGGLLASYAKDRPAARHTINRFPMEHVGPVWIALGLFIVAWWMAHHLR